MKKVLIVEDDTNLQLVYRKTLEAAGYSVIVEGEGRKGLSLVRTEKPDIVILDIMLQDGVNGFDILEQMKFLPETQHIPSIILTNLDTEAATARDIGADRYLIKVNTPTQTIVDTVRELIGN